VGCDNGAGPNGLAPSVVLQFVALSSNCGCGPDDGSCGYCGCSSFRFSSQTRLRLKHFALSSERSAFSSDRSSLCSVGSLLMYQLLDISFSCLYHRPLGRCCCQHEGTRLNSSDLTLKPQLRALHSEDFVVRGLSFG
jgi:hypothetical protein